MKVTFVVPGYPLYPVGGMRVVYEHARGLVEAGHRVTIVHPRHRSAPDERRVLRGRARAGNAVRTLREWARPPAVGWHEVDRRVRMRFATSLHPRHIPRGDAVIATAWWTTEFVDRYPASKGARFSLLQHYEDWSGPRDRVDATWRLPIRKLVVSRWLLDKGVDLGVPEADLRVVPNGLSLEDYPVLQPVESRPKRVAMLVSGERWKGTAEGIRALELARMRHPDLTASCFGVDEPPDGLPAWASYVRRPSLEVLVRDVYNGSAIYLCPSWSEGWGLPSTEAMASGCALVSTNVVGDYAIDGETALLAPPRDPEALAAHLVTLLDDPERRTALARRGREAIGGCTWERSTAALIRSLVDGVDGSWQPGPGRAEGHVPR